jgi:hypothetical protein
VLDSPRTSVMGEQLQRDPEVSLTDASRLLRRETPEVGKNSFSVLSPTNNGGFRKREADPRDENSMASALSIGSDNYYLTRTNRKRLKLTSPSLGRGRFFGVLLASVAGVPCAAGSPIISVPVCISNDCESIRELYDSPTFSRLLLNGLCSVGNVSRRCTEPMFVVLCPWCMNKTVQFLFFRQNVHYM